MEGDNRAIDVDEPSDEFLKELEKKRMDANAEAEKQRAIRNRMNEEAKKWAEKRDTLNADSKTHFETANEHKRLRNELNVKVRDAKIEREKWRATLDELEKKFASIRRKKLPKGGKPLSKLRKELRELEFKQMTSVLTVEKERKLVEMLSKLKSKICAIENVFENDDEVKNLRKELEFAKEQYRSYKKLVEQYAIDAQKSHDIMRDAYRKSIALRREADTAQENFIASKLAADEAHRKHIEAVQQVHNYDKMITALRQKQIEMRRAKEMDLTRKRAEAIFERFKQGEKLSTEDLMTLQKAGYL